MSHRHRDPVPLIQTVDKHLVSGSFKSGGRELIVAALDFLHRQNVDVFAFQERRHSIQASANRVHVPSRYTHRYLPKNQRFQSTEFPFSLG